jgi:hypothetical protein
MALADFKAYIPSPKNLHRYLALYRQLIYEGGLRYPKLENAGDSPVCVTVLASGDIIVGLDGKLSHQHSKSELNQIGQQFLAQAADDLGFFCDGTRFVIRGGHALLFLSPTMFGDLANLQTDTPQAILLLLIWGALGIMGGRLVSFLLRSLSAVVLTLFSLFRG